jgi:hypothetical protein
MHQLAQLNLAAKGGEAKVHALLEDVVEYHQGVYPEHKLALAVWFARSSAGDVQHLLELFSGTPRASIEETQFSLLWKTGSESPPFVRIHATSVEHFSQQFLTNRRSVARFFENPEVLYFDKDLVASDILREFRVITDPPGLLKGWYVNENQYEASRSFRDTMATYCSFRPQVGLVKTHESADFRTCKGVPHVEVGQRWLPLSPAGVKIHTFFNDLQDGRPGYFVFEGGSAYRILKFEVTTAPQYANLVLEPPRDDRYVEVYLRSVYPPS